MPVELSEYLDLARRVESLDLARRVESLAVAEKPGGIPSPDLDSALEYFVSAAQYLLIAARQAKVIDAR